MGTDVAILKQEGSASFFVKNAVRNAMYGEIPV